MKVILTEVLDSHLQESAEVVLPPRRTAFYSLTPDDLETATLVLLESRNGGGSYTEVARITAGETPTSTPLEGILHNDSPAWVRYKAVLTGTGDEDALDGEAEVVISVEAAVASVLRAPHTDEVLAVYTDQGYELQVPIKVASLNAASLPTYADNAAALAAGEVVGTVYATAAGAMNRVVPA